MYISNNERAMIKSSPTLHHFVNGVEKATLGMLREQMNTASAASIKGKLDDAGHAILNKMKADTTQATLKLKGGFKAVASDIAERAGKIHQSLLKLKWQLQPTY